MLKNLVRIAFRNLYKDFGYSSLNIFGLTIGITSALFLMIYVADEVTYDRYNEKANQIYRVSSHIKSPDDEFTWIVAQFPFGPQVDQDYPEVQSFVRFVDCPSSLYRYGEKEFYEEKFYYADSTVFDIFSYEFVCGNPREALLEPNKIVITEKTANKYFGTANPIGKTLVSDNNSFEVTGVIKDIPSNSHFRFEGLASIKNLPKDFGSWIGFGICYTYLLLPEHFDAKAFEVKLREIWPKYMAKIAPDIKGNTFEYILEPLTRIHLYSSNQGEPEPTGSIEYIYIFSTVAFFLILIATINYINLATARSGRRSREVGLRKVVGSSRSSIILQFLAESVMLTTIALILSVVLLELLLPSFNELSGKSFDLHIVFSPAFGLCLLGIVIVVGIVGGSYPAFYLSRFNPATVLKGGKNQGATGNRFRKLLVVVQFAVSIAMIVCTLIVYKQITYMKTKDQGYDQKRIISINFDERLINEYALFKRTLLENPNVQFVTSTNRHVGEGSGKTIFELETDEGMSPRSADDLAVDHDFIEALGIKMLKGRDFQEDIPGDTLTGVVINEALAKRMNWSNPIGKRVVLGDYINGRVIGLMKDYHYTGMYGKVESLVLLYRPCNDVIYVKLSGNDIQGTLRFVESKWKTLFPDKPFEYSFLTDRFNRQFSADEKRGVIFFLFTILAIFIASLGLFGLVSYMVEKRTKEIGIRKVVGANQGAIVKMISNEFTILVLISMATAFPVAYYLMNSWLGNYLYQTTIGPMEFIAAAVITISITYITISYKAYRAANKNPIASLKYE